MKEVASSEPPNWVPSEKTAAALGAQPCAAVGAQVGLGPALAP